MLKLLSTSQSKNHSNIIQGILQNINEMFKITIKFLSKTSLCSGHRPTPNNEVILEII
jgi:hypothetical protein